MALDSSKARSYSTGEVNVGTATATAPTDADTPLSSGWSDLGYITDAGVEIATSRSFTDVNAWQNGDTVRRLMTSSSVTFHFVMQETTLQTLAVYLGTTVNAEDGSVVVVPGRTGGRKKWVIDGIDGNDYARFYIPAGEVTDIGNRTIAGTGLTTYEVTIQAYPDASIATADGANAAYKEWHSELVDPDV
jgi:hypothetical protein